MARDVRSCAIRRSICAGVVAVALVATDARGQVDMSGLWAAEIEVPGVDGRQDWTVTQSGMSLSVVIAGIRTDTWTGTIDPLTGNFSLTLPTAEPGCPPWVITAVVNPSSTSFSGTYHLFVDFTGCEMALFPIEGRRCGNGVLDPGEQCEDGDFEDGDCCSATCQLDPAGTSCAAPNSCNADTCDGAGTCMPGPPADGRPCDDLIFCNGADTCQGGTCSSHAGDPCPATIECRACNEFLRLCFTPPGFGCTDDGNECTVDVCDANMVCQHPAAVTAPCTPDSNPCTLDECDGAATCQHPASPSFYFCPDDGKGCTLDMCDGAGSCLHTRLPAGRGCVDGPGGVCGRVCDGLSDTCPTSGLTPAGTRDRGCLPCETCDGQGACVAAPVSSPPCKQPVVSGASRLRWTNTTPDFDDRLRWKWHRGEATTLAEFGSPDTVDDYALCVYEAASAPPQPIVRLQLLADTAVCSEPPCWRRNAKRLRFRERMGNFSGITSVVLKSGASGHASITLSAQGPLLPLPDQTLSTPILVQLQGDQGECWEATYSTLDRNDGSQLKARSD